MSNAIGIDIGGTKIAGAVFDEKNNELAQVIMPLPHDYYSFLGVCRKIVDQLEAKTGKVEALGISIPYVDEFVCANIPFLKGMTFKEDLEKILGRSIPFGNDANCAALAEAMEGAGKGYNSVFGLIMGTGIGGGFIFNGHMMHGANGMGGEIGHIPLPHYDPADGELVACGCGQTGCLEKLIAGAALARLYKTLTGQEGDARKIGALAQANDDGALRTLDYYYSIVAKAMVVVLHSFDPEIITVSGGLNALPGLYEEVPKRWGKYTFNKKPITKFVPAAFGSMAGLRGAAHLGREGAMSR